MFVKMASIVLLALLTCLNAAQGEPAQRQGANGLFIGHSFFAPVAHAFGRIATERGFSGHSAQIVFAGGPRGLPGALWRDEEKRARIERILAGGDIALLGMPMAADRDGGARETYRHWIDLALSYNRQTAFFIGHSWIPGGPQMDARRFDQKIRETGEETFAIVLELRRLYPNTKIIFLNYGIVASHMRLLFENGDLSDITRLVASPREMRRSGRVADSGDEANTLRERLRARVLARRSGEDGDGAIAPDAHRVRDALFIDPMMGHAGEMMTHIMALLWVSNIYSESGLDLIDGKFNPDDVMAVFSQVDQFNQNFAH